MIFKTEGIFKISFVFQEMLDQFKFYVGNSYGLKETKEIPEI